MIYKVTFILMVVALAGAGMAGAFEVEATVDRDAVRPGERIMLTVALTGGKIDSAPVLPMLTDFNVSGPSYSTRIQVINARTSISTSYEYVLEPLKKGALEIGPIEVAYREKKYTTKPIRVEVSDTAVRRAPRGPTAARRGARKPDAAVSGRGMFVELAADRKEVYLHEQVTLYFRFYYAAISLAERPSYEPPPTPGFVQQTLGKGESRSYAKVIDGRRYQVSELSTALFPYRTGTLTVGPAGLKGDILVQGPGRRRQFGGIFDDFFSDPFFGNYSKKRFELKSNTIDITVLPLPAEGAPDGEPSVGRYSLEVGAKPKEVRVGDPITLTMKVSGTGDLETVAPPMPAGLENFKSYDVTSSVRVTDRSRRIKGVKTFEQAIVPLSEQVDEIPRIEFSYFDPRKKRYVTLTKGPIPIKVLPPGEGGTSGIISLPGGTPKRGVDLIERNIVFIKTGPGKLAGSGDTFHGSAVFWVIQCVPLLLVFLSVLHQRHRMRLRSDLGYFRLRSAGRTTRARLKSVESSLGKGDDREFYGGLVRTLNGYISDRLNVPGGGLTPESVMSMIEERGISGDLVTRIRDFYESCDLARFALGGSGKKEMEAAYTEATGILEALRRQRL